MKASIATLHGANNVGAFLQAYSLQTVIESLIGEDNCSFIRFPSEGTGNNSKLQKVARYLKQGRLGTVLFKYNSAKKYAEAMALLHMDPERFSPDKEYDAVIVGSDEVWNLDSPTFKHHPQFFAKNIQAKTILSYAPSAGNCSVERMKELGADFSGFHHLSVRDENAYAAVREIDGRIPERVCDPTILIESFSHLIKPVPIKDYILVYSYSLDRREIPHIKQYARKHKKKLISVGTYNSWCDKNVVVGPVEFLSWLNGADEVITSTFHGTVLSMRLHKQMAVYAGTNKKVNNVLKQMGLENRIVSAQKDLSAVLETNIDYSAVEERIQAVRGVSMQYLKNSLGLHREETNEA